MIYDQRTWLVKPCHWSDAIWIVFSSHSFISGGFKAVDNTTSIYSSFGWFHLQNFWALGETTFVIASNAKIETRSTRIQKRCAWVFALANGWWGSFSACGRWHVETTVPEQGLMVGTNQNQSGHFEVVYVCFFTFMDDDLMHIREQYTYVLIYFTVTWPCSALSFKLQGEILFLKVQCLCEHVSILVEDPKHFKICLTKKCEVGFLPSKTRNNLPRFQAPERDAFITWPVNTGNWGSTLWDSNNPIGSSVWGKNATCQKLVLGLHPRLPKRSLVKSDPIQSQKETVIYVAAKILPSLVSGLWNCPDGENRD